MTGTAGAKTWATEWAAQKAAQALEYLGRNFIEFFESRVRARGYVSLSFL